ncbi:MAG: site-specific integrase, partial [Ignavibacteria bacterium]
MQKPVSPHWLRHAHVSHSLDRGCPVHVVSQTVGHASLNSTTRY